MTIIDLSVFIKKKHKNLMEARKEKNRFSEHVIFKDGVLDIKDKGHND